MPARHMTRAALRARRWAAAGRELERCDPSRRGALLLLAEQVIRAHRKSNAIARKRGRDLMAETRRRLARR
jgi:hypothetical protein